MLIFLPSVEPKPKTPSEFCQIPIGSSQNQEFNLVDGVSAPNLNENDNPVFPRSNFSKPRPDYCVSASNSFNSSKTPCGCNVSASTPRIKAKLINGPQFEKEINKQNPVFNLESPTLNWIVSKLNDISQNQNKNMEILNDKFDSQNQVIESQKREIKSLKDQLNIWISHKEKALPKTSASSWSEISKNNTPEFHTGIDGQKELEKGNLNQTKPLIVFNAMTSKEAKS